MKITALYQLLRETGHSQTPEHHCCANQMWGHRDINDFLLLWPQSTFEPRKVTAEERDDTTRGSYLQPMPLLPLLHR